MINQISSFATALQPMLGTLTNSDTPSSSEAPAAMDITESFGGLSSAFSMLTGDTELSGDSIGGLMQDVAPMVSMFNPVFGAGLGMFGGVLQGLF